MTALPGHRHYPPGVAGDPRYEAWRIGVLLEEGSSAELRALIAELGVDRLRRWLVERGGRQLTRRSFAFWRLLLAADVEVDSRRSELWPL